MILYMYLRFGGMHVYMHSTPQLGSRMWPHTINEQLLDGQSKHDFAQPTPIKSAGQCINWYQKTKKETTAAYQIYIPN